MAEKSLRKKIFKRLSILISVFYIVNLSFGDIIILKKDEVIKGKLISKQGDFISFKTEDGKILSLKEDQVAVIEFLSDKVVEVQLNGKKLKGVQVGETKEGVVVKTALGEQVVRKSQVKELSQKVSNEPLQFTPTTNYITNTLIITNEFLITNMVFITNSLTNHLSNDNNFVSRNVGEFFVNVGGSYDFRYVYLTYFSGIRIEVINGTFFSVYVGKLMNGILGGYQIEHELVDWLRFKGGIGGLFESSKGNFLLSGGMEFMFDLGRINIILPIDVFWVNPYLIINLGVGFSI